MHIQFPFRFNQRGRTATTDGIDHIRDMIEQILFTSPGERVNRPDFGTGILDLVFDPDGAELTQTVQYTVKGALDRWLGDIIDLQDVEVTSEGSTLRVVIQYFVRAEGVARSVTFERSVG